MEGLHSWIFLLNLRREVTQENMIVIIYRRLHRDGLKYQISLQTM